MRGAVVFSSGTTLLKTDFHHYAHLHTWENLFLRVTSYTDVNKTLDNEWGAQTDVNSWGLFILLRIRRFLLLYIVTREHGCGLNLLKTWKIKTKIFQFVIPEIFVKHLLVHESTYRQWNLRDSFTSIVISNIPCATIIQ